MSQHRSLVPPTSADNPEPTSSSETMTNYKRTPLFGGAMECDLPDNFLDVSLLRQIEDNQEVFIDRDGYTSIVIDLLVRVKPKKGEEREDKIEEDGFALVTHLKEVALVDSEEDELDEDTKRLKVWNTTETEFSKIAERERRKRRPSPPTYTLFATDTPRAPKPSSTHENARTNDFTAIFLTLLRLKDEDTDIVISVNVPHIKGEYDEDDVDLELGKQGRLIGDAVEYTARIWESFDIKDKSVLHA